MLFVVLTAYAAYVTIYKWFTEYKGTRHVSLGIIVGLPIPLLVYYWVVSYVCQG